MDTVIDPRSRALACVEDHAGEEAIGRSRLLSVGELQMSCLEDVGKRAS